MKEYHKIQGVFKQDDKKKFLIGDYTLPEFEYLQNCKWIGTEKVDGTNIRVMWTENKLRFGGKTDNAQILSKLYDRLIDLFPIDKLSIYDYSLCLYGEGFGNKIGKSGHLYIPDGLDFVLFDVKVGDWWLRRQDIEDVASKLGIQVVPIVFEGTLNEAIEVTKNGFKSQWGDFLAEGLVLKTEVELKNRNGDRIITKIKTINF